MKKSAGRKIRREMYFNGRRAGSCHKQRVNERKLRKARNGLV